VLGWLCLAHSGGLSLVRSARLFFAPLRGPLVGSRNAPGANPGALARCPLAACVAAGRRHGRVTKLGRAPGTCARALARRSAACALLLRASHWASVVAAVCATHAGRLGRGRASSRRSVCRGRSASPHCASDRRGTARGRRVCARRACAYSARDRLNNNLQLLAVDI